MDLFDPELLTGIDSQEEALSLRPLNTGDFDKGFLQLLGQLTEVGVVSKDEFLDRFFNMKHSGGYYVIVIEDLNTQQIIACSTLVIEQKFIHHCGKRGRLEDVVVNKNYRGKQLGKCVVQAVTKLSRSLMCYKLSLECKDGLIPFYESIGFVKEPGNANALHIRFNVP